MEPFLEVTGPAAPFPAADVDTDVIMPKQFLKGVDRSGLDRGVFFDLRFLPDGSENPDFILNQPGWRGSAFLVVGPNFGCGSSREHAVWGLRQLGVRAVLGTSFAGIFYDNCARNGLLALTLPPVDLERVMSAAADPSRNTLAIDLRDQTIRFEDGQSLAFDIDRSLKDNLLAGLDPVGRTLLRRDAIAAFEARHLEANPWLAEDLASRP